MDFGLVGVDGLVLGQNASSPSSPEQQHHHHHQVLEGKPKGIGSGLIKQERSDPFGDDENRASKMVKRGDDLGLRSDNVLPKQQMLSFASSTKPQQVNFLTAKDVGLIADKNAQNLVLSYFQQPPSSPAHSRTPGFNSGNLNGSMHGSFTGIRGPFTPAQWIELEHQAMIYKYLTANVPVPPNLLIPIRKALSSSGFPGFSFGSYPAHSYGWGTFHLGFSGSTDPEPGRCRRTDGKKWRCSRDAVPDQKYCERHINRGRHRSRKPVEGHTGQAASGPTNTKAVPAMSASMSSLVTSNVGASNSVATAHQHQLKGLHSTTATDTPPDSIVNRFHDEQGLSVMPQAINLKTNDSSFSIAKQHIPLVETSQSEFGIVSTDSLLNPTQKRAYLDCKSYNSSILEFNAQQTQNNYSLRDFTDTWPKDNGNRSTIPWAEDLKSDWTQLSMSIPMSTSHDKMEGAPLRLSREIDPSLTGLGVGTIVGETGMKQNAWIPISWGSSSNNNNNNSMGGPLGEVLKNTSNVTSTLNLKREGSNGSPQLGSSPTGVLQKSTFVSLSNSSSAGSPGRGESKRTMEGGSSLCDDILCSAAHASSPFVPSM